MKPKRVIKPTPKAPKRDRFRPGRRASGKMSGYEEKVEKSLAMRGVEYEYEKEILSYIKPPVPAKKGEYNPDFTFTTERGTKVYVEAKGLWTPKDRKKMLLVIEQNPDKDIRMLFERNNYLTKNKKTTYGMYCDKHNIKWAVSNTGHIPESWIRGDE